MTIDLHVYHHIDYPARDRTLDQILAQLHVLTAQGVQMQQTADQMKQSLIDANTTTNEIAADIADLKAKLAGGLSAVEAVEIQGQLDTLVSRLTDVASEHTPTP